MSSDIKRRKMYYVVSINDNSDKKKKQLYCSQAWMEYLRYLSATIKGNTDAQRFILMGGKQVLFGVHIEYLYNLLIFMQNCLGYGKGRPFPLRIQDIFKMSKVELILSSLLVIY